VSNVNFPNSVGMVPVKSFEAKELKAKESKLKEKD